MGYCGRGRVSEKLGKQLKDFEGITFQPFPNLDQFAQIDRKTSLTERLNEESHLKQLEEATVQELD